MLLLTGVVATLSLPTPHMQENQELKSSQVSLQKELEVYIYNIRVSDRKSNHNLSSVVQLN